MAGHAVCRTGFAGLLGISPRRLVRTKAAFKGLDTRNVHTSRRSSPQQAEVDVFLRKLYHSAAESLPHGFRFGGDLSLDIAALPRLRAELVEALLDSALDGPLLALAREVKKLPQKHLPPGKPADIYQLYQASCLMSGIKAASAFVFYGVWNRDWKHVLVFRKTSTHTTCSLCHKLKSEIRCAKNLQAHLDYCDWLLRHMARQWADRHS